MVSRLVTNHDSVYNKWCVINPLLLIAKNIERLMHGENINRSEYNVTIQNVNHRR